MKKTLIFTSILLATSLVAQVKLPDFPNAPRAGFIDIPQNVTRMASLNIPNDEAMPMMPESQPSGVAPRLLNNGVHATNEALPHAGYLNPAGTLFLGIDEAGEGTWFTKGGIVGAWSDSIDVWKFQQNITGDYDSVNYNNGTLSRWHDDVAAFFRTDNEGNYLDSMVAAGGWDEYWEMGGYGDGTLPWNKGMPLQTVTRPDKSVEKFMLLNKSTKPSLDGAGYLIGGLPSSKTADGLWPMTNAVNISTEGVSMDWKATTDEDGYVHYIFGTDSLNTDTIEEGGIHYTRVAPVAIVTEYDKPQAPMYIKSITMALFANGYNPFNKGAIKVNELTAKVIDKDGTVIATATATANNLKDMNSKFKSGRMLTFSFAGKQSEYGEPLSEGGFMVADAFKVVIEGFSKDDAFGIYSAKSTLHPSHSYIEYEGGITAGADYDPYIMLNGIYPTFELYTLTKKVSRYFTLNHRGDTIPINMKSIRSPFYKYQAYYHDDNFAGGSTFEIYSTFAPYDSISRYWTMNIQHPDYIVMGADYDSNLTGDDDNWISLWDYIRAFDLYIYATETPQIGDVISIGKCGRQYVFQIEAIDGATGWNETKEQARQAGVQKLMDQRGHVRILRGNIPYNLLGQPIR